MKIQNMLQIGTALLVCALLIFARSNSSKKKNSKNINEAQEPTEVDTAKRLERNSVDFKKKDFDFGYQYDTANPEPTFKNLNLLGEVYRFGVLGGHDPAFVRALRYKNYTDAIEYRYNLIPGIIFAISAHLFP
jgi:hypothetical protein